MERPIQPNGPHDLFVVTGASGSGKSTIAGPLTVRLRGRCVVFDVDCLLEATKELSGAQPILWNAFREAWLSIAAAVAQSGVPTVLLAPFVPEHLDQLPSRARFADILYFALDCDDELRRERIRARPSVQPDLEAQVDFGRHVRMTIPTQFDTGLDTPTEAVEAVAEWVLGNLA